MAREQTEALPTRDLRPANVAGGQYRVAVQQAPESGYTKLAKALSSFSTGLNSYTQAGESLSEMYEEELQGKTLAQVKAEQAKMQKRLDGAVRKGKLPFLGNPLNWERNQKAIARRYAGLLHSQTVSNEGRFYKGRKDGDQSLTVNEILEQEKAQFLSENPEIASNPLMLQTFDADWTQRSDILNQRFSDQKQKEYIQNIASDTASQLHQFAKKSKDLFTTDSLNELDEIWSGTGNFTRTQQEKVLTSVFKSLAKVDENKAYDLLDATKGKIMIGGQLMGHTDNAQMLDELKDMIGDVARTEMQEDAGRGDEERQKRIQYIQDETKRVFSTYVNTVNDINNVGHAEFDGVRYESKESFDLAFNEHLRELRTNSDDEGVGIVTSNVSQEIDEFTIGRGSITQRSIFEAKTGVQDTLRTTDQTFSDLIRPSISQAISKEIALQDNLDFRIWSQQNNTSRQQIAQEAFVFYQNQRGDEQSRVDATKAFITKRTEEHTTQYLNELNAIIKREEEDQVVVEEQERLIDKAKAAEEPIAVRKLKGVQLFDALEVNYGIFTTSTDKEKSKRAVREFWTWYDTETVQGILQGDIPKSPRVTREMVDFETGGTIPYIVPEVPYSTDELEKLERLYLKVQSAKGIYTEILNYKKIEGGEDDEDLYQVIVGGQPNGYDINIKDLNPNVHRILTEEELLDTESQTAKRKAKMLGRSVESLRKSQTELYEKNREIYRMFEQ